jgi:hypothetical protein
MLGCNEYMELAALATMLEAPAAEVVSLPGMLEEPKKNSTAGVGWREGPATKVVGLPGMLEEPM